MAVLKFESSNSNMALGSEVTAAEAAPPAQEARLLNSTAAHNPKKNTRKFIKNSRFRRYGDGNQSKSEASEASPQHYGARLSAREAQMRQNNGDDCGVRDLESNEQVTTPPHQQREVEEM